MARHGNVIEPCDRDVLRHAQAAAPQRVHGAQRGLVVGAYDRARQLSAGVEEAADHPGAAGCAVVALPVMADRDLRPVCFCLGLDRFRARVVVRAVDAPGQVAELVVAVVEHEVAYELAHALVVVAAHVHRAGHRRPGQRHDRNQRCQPGDAGRRDHAVVEDQAVGLAAHSGHACLDVAVVEADRPHEDVEALAPGGQVDAAIDDVDEEEALVLVGEGRLIASPEDHADDLLQAVGQRARRAVGHESELAHGLEDAVPGRGARAALAVQHA